jgi:hypothetical protein
VSIHLYFNIFLNTVLRTPSDLLTNFYCLCVHAVCSDYSNYVLYDLHITQPLLFLFNVTYNKPMLKTASLENGIVFNILSRFRGDYRRGMPITVATRSKAWTIFSRSSAGIVGSILIQGMVIFVRLFCVCAILYVTSGLATGWSPVQGVLPIMYRIKKLKKRSRSNKRTVES